MLSQRHFFENASEIKMGTLNMAVLGGEDLPWCAALRENKKNQMICQTGRTNTDVKWARTEERVQKRGRKMEEPGVPGIGLAASVCICPLRGSCSSVFPKISYK